MKLLIANGYVIDPAQQVNTGGRGVLIEDGRIVGLVERAWAHDGTPLDGRARDDLVALAVLVWLSGQAGMNGGAVGAAAAGPVSDLAAIPLADATVPARAVTLGIAPAGTPEEQVAFDSPADITEGEFSGTLDVSSALDRGATFTLELPRLSPEAASLKPEAALRPGA